MVYDYTVKMNGEYYPAGTEVPDDNRIQKDKYLSDINAVVGTEPVRRGRPKKNQR